MAEKKTLVTKRGQIKGQLTRFETYLNSIDKPIVKPEVSEALDNRLLDIKSILEEFNSVQSQLELVESGDDVEEEHFNIYSPPNVDQTNNVQNVVGVKLPTVQLPVFAGNYDKWMEFYDTFDSLIHQNNTISEIQKFHYLKSSLKNEAAAVIQSLEVSAANYSIAWKLLRERFENKRLIVYNHVSALFNLKPVVKESHVSLRTILDRVLNHLRALKALNQPTDEWDTLLIHLVNSKLDHTTRREWEFYKIKGEMPKFDEYSSFLRERCDILETVNGITNTELISGRNSNSKQMAMKPSIKGCLVSSAIYCTLCKGQHSIYNCTEFLNLRIDQRLLKAKTLKLCINCLRKGHFSRDCKSTTCRKCSQKHNTLLHLEVSEPQLMPSEQQSTSSISNHATSDDVGQVILSTACIKVYDNQGKDYNCRVLLDSGSQSNFITENMCSVLKLRKHRINASITGINQVSLPIQFKTDVRISSLCNNFQTEISCLVMNKITDQLPSLSFDPSALKIPHNIRLADPNFYKAENIDMLIGSQLFWNLLSVGQIELGKNLPLLQKTQLGWVISGNIPARYISPIKSYCSLEQLDSQLKKFWSIEEFSKAQLSPEEQYCEDLFVKTTERNNEGRFVVRVPFTRATSELGESKNLAVQRQLSLERKLVKNPQLMNEYKEFMREYESLGHMTLVSEPQMPDQNFYLPHHAVIKADSTTTKLRVVFDGSAKSSTGVAVNDIQAVGPPLQQDLVSVLLRFRCHEYVATADISKMYRQILIHTSQRDTQRIVWRNSSHEPLQTFTLNTVTYGMASAPFLAMRCLKQLAIENKHSYPKASESILNDFYVDDLLTGSNSRIEMIQTCKTIDDILKGAGFELRNWTSNNPEAVQEVSQGTIDSNQHIVKLGENSKILGVFWCPSEDSLQYNIKPSEVLRITKRTILSTVAQIYDPLGLLSPVTIVARIIIQQLWQSKLHWDESIPTGLYTKWKEFIYQLPIINTLNIPRYIMCKNTECIEIHGFCDASSVAYGCCIYIRSINSQGQVTIHLSCAKSKVAPLKALSIPRLELCAALLLTQLVDRVKASFPIKINNFYYWSDSMITLSWIRGSSQMWKTFVANRVAAIQTSSNISDWYHVRSEENPADVTSRGISPRDLPMCSLWWSGPSWLSHHQTFWPEQVSDYTEQNDTLLDRKKPVATFTSTIDMNILTKYSSFMKLKPIFAYVLRFISNCRLPQQEREINNLTTGELRSAETCIIKIIQIQCFPNEIADLRKSKSVHSKSKLLCLHPFIDDSGLIRVGGRLNQSSFAYHKKHPLVLPSKNTVTDLIMRDEHIRLLHTGPQALLASIRERYWPLSGRNTTRKIVRECVTCFRAKPVSNNQLMGSLPANRLTQRRPFLVSGVDYAGPFLLKDRKTRGAKVIKAYVCLFVCFTTRAVHLELVCDLTTKSFLDTLRRFTSRRGHCSEIYSDNATNFVGANNELQELTHFFHNENDNLSTALATENIHWHFIPPRSPHFGGLWEAGIRSSKHHLHRVLANTRLTYDEFYTVLVRIEACLNSRPLSPLTTDPSDMNPLTPAHFLIGESLVSVPDPVVMDVPESRLTLYQQRQRIPTTTFLGSLVEGVRLRTSTTSAMENNGDRAVKERNYGSFKRR